LDLYFGFVFSEPDIFLFIYWHLRSQRSFTLLILRVIQLLGLWHCKPLQWICRLWMWLHPVWCLL